MSSILNNISALGASRQLGITGANLQNTIERLTTGRRINKASDDAAGLAIGNKLNADIKIVAQAQRNANDGVSYLQVADGALEEVTNLLTRATQLAQQAQTGTLSASNRLNLDAEFQNIIKTIGNIGTNTKFNDTSIFGASTTNVSIQAGAYGTLTFGIASIASNSISAFGLTAGTDSLTGSDGTNAASAAADLALALDSVSSIRATIGASQQQLNGISSILGIEVQNYTAAYSQIQDANVADEVVNLTKFQILNQSGTSALAKSNQSAQQVLALLQ